MLALRREDSVSSQEEDGNARGCAGSQGDADGAGSQGGRRRQDVGVAFLFTPSKQIADQLLASIFGS